MPYLIDGHNLIPRVPGLSLAAIDDEDQLLALMGKFCLQQNTRAEVFFDKAPPGHIGRRSHGRVTAVFVREGSTADAAIERRLLRLKGDAPNWKVVSSDREVQRAAHRARAKVIPADEFARELVAGSTTGAVEGNDEKPAPVPEETEEWLEIFLAREDGDKQGEE
jgi:predicted RNA-binding protein with PIN domain